MTSFISNGMYRRGTGTPLAKDLGNPHITIRPLRQALYARKLSPESCTVKFIHETFCEWDEEEEVVRWVEEDVFPDATLDHLLDQPEAAFRHFFGRTLSITDESAFDAKDWDKHVFALYSVVFEICSLAGGPSLLELLLKQFESTEQIEKTMSKISLVNGRMGVVC